MNVAPPQAIDTYKSLDTPYELPAPNDMMMRDLPAPDAAVLPSDASAAKELQMADIGNIPLDSSTQPNLAVPELPAEPAEGEVYSPSEATQMPEIVEEPAGAVPPMPTAQGFVWPVRGEILQSYSAENKGINIAARKGTPIRSVGDGVVQFAGNKIKGYGNLIIVAHPNGYYSAYAHADDMVVAKGAKVVQGQLIGFVGDTGVVDRPQLYFSLRNGSDEKSSVNPIPLLTDG